MFNFLRNHHIVFHGGCTIFHCHQQCTRVPIFLHPHQHLLFSVVFFVFVFVLIRAILMGIRWWCLIVFFFFLNRSLQEYNCFTILCQFFLYTKVNETYAYICPHIPSLLSLPPILPIPPLQVIAKHQADLPVLCCCFPLTISHSVVYICRRYSHFTPDSPSYLCPQVHSLCLHLYSCPATRFISTFFFFKIPYICVSIRYLFFSF